MAAISPRSKPRPLLSILSSRPSISSSSSPNSSDPEADPNETLISTAISILKEHRSRSRWSQLKAILPPTGISPSATVRILSALRNRPHLALAFFTFSRCNDLLSFSAAAHIAARSRLRPAALRLLSSAVRLYDSPAIFETLTKTYRSFDSAPFVFDLLILAYLDAKKFDRAVYVTRLLLSRGIHPLLSTSNSLIRSVSKLNGSDAGLGLYQELFGSDNPRVSPNVQIFNTLLLALYQDRQSDRVHEIRVEMEKLRVDPNVFTYSILLAGLCEDGKRIREAKELWDEMAGKGIKPDIMAFNTMINGYCKTGEMVMAEALHRDMVLNGIDATCTTYEHLIRGHCKVGNLETGMVLYKDMKRKGFAAGVEVVDEVLDEMCKRDRVDEGLVILRKEMKREGFSPSRRSYEVLIRGFCERGMMDTAAKLQAEMAGRGFEADKKVYDAFVEGYRRIGEEDKVMRLCEEMNHMITFKESVT
ncbi:CO dehydrogenase ISP C-domain like protein [Dioscorea alata]|uniref:CO dehydrogenase ISP C-domain like protein n=1 Tax=Dioscorea alata TaxID=55571 RepID=A0ACB7UKG8_DIOAL|nr:CO dehydrogenase ISP C-domain like protein [Dioscorea alata]